MPEKLVLNDGTELYGCAEEYDGKLAVYIHGKTMAEAFGLMSDTHKTIKMISRRNDGNHTYRKFTHIKEIVEAGEQFIVVTMEKE